MNKKDHFIVFLSLSLIFVVLVTKYFLGNSLALISKRNWLVSQEKALALVNNQKEVKAFLAKGESRKVDQFGIVISQPKISLEASPSSQKPFWEFHVFEEVTEIPKKGIPSSHTATFNWYQINARTGQIKKTF